jgi:hypothetical protein
MRPHRRRRSTRIERRRPGRGVGRGVLVVLTLLLLSLPAFPGALAQTDDVTPPPEPTSTPTPAPTDTPSPEPTSTPTPAPTDTPTPEPTSTPTPIPTSTPAPAPTSTATPKPTTTPTPAPTSTPAPAPQDGGFSAQSVVSGSGCSQTSPTDIVELTESVQFRCPAVSGGGLTYRRTFSMPTAGWQYAIDGGSFRTASSSSSPLVTTPEVTVALRPTGTVLPGQSGTMTVTTERCSLLGVGSTCPSGWQLVDATTIGATRGCLTVVPTVSIHAVDFGAIVWSGVGYPTVRRQVVITISGPVGCVTMSTDWAVQIGTTGLTGPGNVTIPASAFAYAGSSGSAPGGLTPGAGGQPLTSAGTRIATGSSTVLNGSQWTITLELLPPTDAPPGLYTATIVVTTVSPGM